MGALLIFGFIVLALIIGIALIACNQTMSIPCAGMTTGSGYMTIPKIRLRGHKFVYADCDDPNGMWKTGDILIVKPAVYTKDNYYVFVKYDHTGAVPFYPYARIAKCKECGHGNRPVFDHTIGSEYDCYGMIVGVRVNGINMIYK